MAKDIKNNRIAPEDQWYDPALLFGSNGSEVWARWATRWLYSVFLDVDTIDSFKWPEHGIITQFDRDASFAFSAGTTTLDDIIPTNARNWLLLSRAATAINTAGGAAIPLANFNVEITVPTKTFLLENQPIINVFGTGTWPHVLFFPEEWSANVARTITVNNNSGINTALVDLSFKFLQVRTN